MPKSSKNRKRKTQNSEIISYYKKRKTQKKKIFKSDSSKSDSSKNGSSNNGSSKNGSSNNSSKIESNKEIENEYKSDLDSKNGLEMKIEPIPEPVSKENLYQDIRSTFPTDRYSVLFTEKHRSFFINSKDRIFSNRTNFNKSIVRFNTSFALELKIPSPITNNDYDDFIKNTPQRVLSVPEGECAVIVSGMWKNEDLKVGRIIHASMVYNNKGKYYIFNANDDPKTYDDGFYDCYTDDNPLFLRPLRVRKTALHEEVVDGACFVISYALKLLCETMPFNKFLNLVTKKSLYEIMKKCFEELE
jgi:hypothetical protein